MEQENEVATERAEGRARSRRSLFRFGGVVAAGMVIGGTLTRLLHDTGDTSTGLLEEVPTADLPQLRSTLSPAAAPALIDEAQRCQEPLARVVILHSAGSAGGVISIRSGGYRSPAFALTATPTLVGLPFPAPYQAGKGVLVIDGNANDLVIALTPSKILTVAGSVAIPVHWTPASNCR